MNPDDNNGLWQGLDPKACEALQTRDYTKADLATRLATTGVEAGELATEKPGPKLGLEDVWIPGVEVFHRQVYQQRHRGWFAEFARENEGRLHDIGLWPQQWATATMFANTAKGFHIHPPSIPEGMAAADWFEKLYSDEPGNYDARRYDHEQWDAMFFVQGTIEFLLVDERIGMPRRTMRFIIEGDNRPGAGNIGLVIPAGVAHALRCAGSQDVIMVYGTSTSFEPTFEGRIAAGVEECPLPDDWVRYINQ
jgi:dTDP-4-dehydrorhamnose 3,5-epimerase-like enzyme